MALCSLSVLAGALSKAQVGDLLVASIRNKMKIVLDQTKVWNDRTSEEVFNNFSFDYQDQYSSDLSIPNFVSESKALFDNFGDDKKNICIIVSDGRMNKQLVRPCLAEAEMKDYLYLFIILDKADENDSILNYKTTSVENENGQFKVVIKDYLEDFPFRYYIVVKVK